MFVFCWFTYVDVGAEGRASDGGAPRACHPLKLHQCSGTCLAFWVRCGAAICFSRYHYHLIWHCPTQPVFVVAEAGFYLWTLLTHLLSQRKQRKIYPLWNKQNNSPGWYPLPCPLLQLVKKINCYSHSRRFDLKTSQIALKYYRKNTSIHRLLCCVFLYFYKQTTII